MQIFRPEVQAVLRMLTIAALVGMIVAPVMWGYEQRRQAQTWRAVACAYRMRELVRQAPLFADVDVAGGPCATLDRLGLDVDPRR